MHDRNTQTARSTSPLDYVLLALTLLVTAVLSLAVSAHRLLWQDEFLSFYSDGQPTARGVVEVQLHYPISLDPPTYHLLSHAAMSVMGQSAIALRLPALLGFLLMQIALFLLVRRLAGARAGVVAALLPLLTASFRYSWEGRPYGWLLGLYAAAFTCWYVAAARASRRAWPLLGMALAVALAITSHYFGVLILVPLAFAELVRARQRHALDWPMLGAGAAGAAALAVDLPFQRALAPYRTHYYINSVSIRAISQGYRELFVRYTTWPMPLQKATAIVLVVATIALVAAAWRRFCARPAGEPAALWAGLLGFALLPFFGFLIGRFVTHTMEVRYVIATLLAFAVVIALLLQQRLGDRRFYLGFVAVLLGAAIALGVLNISSTRRESRAVLAGMQPSAALLAAAAVDPAAPIYIGTLDEFYLDSRYVADPALRRRFALLYDEGREVGILHHNTNAVTARNMQHFTRFHIVPYGTVLASPEPLFLHYDSTWEWAGKDLTARHVDLLPLGAALRGELYRIEP